MNLDDQNQQKAIWHQDAEQLKSDLAGRPKEVKYNPKTIRFGGVAPTTKNRDNKMRLNTDRSSDDQVRKLLGI